MKKRVLVLAVFVVVIACAFFFASWTNARVVAGEGVSLNFRALGNFSSLAAGLLVVAATGILADIVFSHIR